MFFTLLQAKKICSPKRRLVLTEGGRERYLRDVIFWYRASGAATFRGPFSLSKLLLIG
jgi:hypothetical protein